MNKKSFLFIAYTLISTAQAEVIKGVVESIDPQTNQAKIRTATEDIFVNIYDTKDSVQEALRAPGAKRSIQTFDLPTNSIMAKRPAPMRADCSELPVNINELEKIASSSSDMVDFLKKIPEGTLQGFTFVTNSLSLHRGQKDKDGNGQVSAMWPRVLRSSIDGKMTVSFVCDQKNPTFGRVEIIYFDDKKNEFRTTEFDFGHPKLRNVAPSDRVHLDPQSCVSCHGGSNVNGKVSLKPNWPEYFFWSDCKENRGIQIYGSSDDNMGPEQFRRRSRVNSTQDYSGCSDKEDRSFVTKEQANYQKFREMQKDNPCFNTLPWKNMDQMGADDKFYPYSNYSLRTENDGTQNYSRRTNARFTDAYSHLMAKRLSSIVEKSKEYEIIKYFIAMEEAGCITQDDERKLKEVMPNFKVDKQVRYPSQLSSYSVEQNAPILYNYAKRIDLQNKDWTMEFREDKDPNYNAVMFYGNFGGDAKIYNVTAGNILKDIGDKNPALKSMVDSSLSRGITEVFGSRFSCIDDLGGAVPPGKKRGTSSLCQSLRAENEKHLKSLDLEKILCEEIPKNEVKDMNSIVEVTLKNYTKDQIKKGKELIEMDHKGKCVMCHSSGADMLPIDFQFVPGDKDPKKDQSLAVLRSKSAAFVETLNKRLIETKTMPPKPLGADLTQADREAIKAYLLSLISKK